MQSFWRQRCSRQRQILSQDIRQVRSVADLSPSSARSWTRRDLVILPCLSLLTLIFLLFTAEFVARLFFVDQQVDGCMIPDPIIGFKYRPGCVTRVKAFEGPWVVNRYNGCGYRTAEQCGEKPRGTIRIALIGSSVAEGWLVGYNELFSTRAAKKISESCGRPVEVQNLGREKCGVGCTFHRVDEALVLKPDLLLLALSPSDFEHVSVSDFEARDLPIPSAQPEGRSQGKQDVMRQIKHVLSSSHAVIALEHFLFQDPATYTRIALLEGDSILYLSTGSSPTWERRYQALDLFLGAMEEKASKAKVPLMFIEVPSAAQGAVIALKNPPPDVDPYALNRRLAKISSTHDIRFVDVLDDFRQTPGSNKLFYLTDGHINGQGQALLSAPLVDQLISGTNPLVQGCNTSVLHSRSGSF